MGKFIIVFFLLMPFSYSSLTAHPNPPKEGESHFSKASAIVVNVLPTRFVSALQSDDIESQKSGISTVPLLPEQEAGESDGCLKNCFKSCGYTAGIAVLCPIVTALIAVPFWAVIGFFQSACGCCSCIPNVCPC